MKFDVGIIGGGVIGLSCAWRLAQAGARVGVFERGMVGREASWAAAGMLAAQCEAAHHPPDNDGSTLSARQSMFDLCLQSRALYPSFADELFDATGIDIELSLRGHARDDWRTPGILYVPTRENDPAPRAFSQQREAGHAVESAPDFSGHHAFWLPDEGQVENRKLVQALRLACERSGVHIHQAEPVQKVHHLDGRAANLETNQHGVFCDKVLLCAGAWSHDALHLPVECVPPVQPLAGEMISIRPKKQVRHIVYSDGVYLVPRRDGTVLIGATMDKRGFDKTTTDIAKKYLIHGAIELMPEIEQCEILDHWAGLRPASMDGLPILGSTALANFYVATGHGRNGILLAPRTAQMMADCILNDKAVPGAFSMQRFSEGAK